MFSGYSAWFSPELASYRSTWKNNGGEEKELAEADIAFMNDRSLSNSDRVKPTMKILRPDWIEDSVKGRRRLSLTRYKQTFPALERWDSATFSRNLAVGIDAFKSSKVLSLTSPSKHLHQPEEGIADLPITSLEHSFRPSTLKDTQLSMPESRESQEMEQTQTLSLLSKQSQMERENASPLSDYDRFGPSEGGHLDRWQTRSNIENPSAHRSHTSPSLQSISASLLPKTSPQSVPKKRRLPSTIRGIKRPSPAMKDTRLDDAFFGNSDSDEELSGVVSNNAAHTALKGTTPGQESSNFGTKAPSCSRRSEQAVDYLTRIVTAMDGEKKSLLSDNHPQLHIINVGSENIFLRRKIND